MQKTTLIDYPGKLACTVFSLGCNFRCRFCYASDIVLPEKIKNHPKISEKEFFNFLDAKKGLLEGVVICGGEPTLQPDLPDFIRKIKKLGFSVKLDTNGSNPDILEKLVAEKLVDYVAMDIKASFVNYEKVAGIGVDIKKIKKSIGILKKGKVDYEFRTTIVPGLHAKEDIVQLAKDISPAKKYYLQNFRPERNIDRDFLKVKPYPEELLKDIKKSISHFFNICDIR